MPRPHNKLQSMRSSVRIFLGSYLSLFLPCVTLDRLLNHPETKFPQQKNEALGSEDFKILNVKCLTHSTH